MLSMMQAVNLRGMGHYTLDEWLNESSAVTNLLGAYVSEQLRKEHQ